MEAIVIKSVANETANVVQNDTRVAPSKTYSPIDTLSRLECSRKEWEEGAYRTSNQQLYAILAECYAFAGELGVTESKQRSAALEAFYKERGYRIKKDTPLMTRIVRAVFGDIDRRRLSTYSLVLRAAKAEQVLATNLADWIEQEGGVQEIRMSRSATFVSPKQKVEIAQQNFDSLPVLANVHSEALSGLSDSDFVGCDCVLLATQQADSTYAVRAVLRSNTAVNAAFVSLYGCEQEKHKAALKELTAANEADGAMKAAA
ncbi:hypothetical protein [Dechloromonas sp. ZS-1]|uniref:hypothetical protein n=1 Tax=Dechloromonas sp. ZS-1 TaxID=3138067 RepID=UPI0031FBEAE5